MKIRIVKKTVNKDLADFLEEFSYYKKEGIGYNLSDEDLKQRFNSVKASTVPIKDFDSMANSYTSLISADNEDERFEQLLENYIKEHR